MDFNSHQLSVGNLKGHCSVVDPFPDWIRNEQFCGSGSTQLNKRGKRLY